MLLLLLLLLMMMMMMMTMMVVVVVMMMVKKTTTTMIMMIIMTAMMMLFFRDLKVASRTFRMTLLALQVSAEQSVGWMTAMPSSTDPAYCIQIGPKL